MLSRLAQNIKTPAGCGQQVLARMCFSSTSLPEGVEVKGVQDDQRYREILSFEALAFVARLHRNFNPTRLKLLQDREIRAKALEEGSQPLDFLESTKQVRYDTSWTIAPLPKDLERRRVEITGPATMKMIINALNSGADAYMCDFEDSQSPMWTNQISGQVYIKDAIRHKLSFTDKGKEYKLKNKVATLSVRPRGWHLPEKHIVVDGQPTSGSLIDFGLYFFHNARELVSRGTGPYFYLPKLESHLEARLWNEVFQLAQEDQDIDQGTVKATVLIETLPAAFQMEEILYELREHSAGLNAGRWDYIFSCIKCFSQDRQLVFGDRSLITMTVPFMRAYALGLIRACHKRDAPAIGGMWATSGLFSHMWSIGK